MSLWSSTMSDWKLWRTCRISKLKTFSRCIKIMPFFAHRLLGWYRYHNQVNAFLIQIHEFPPLAQAPIVLMTYGRKASLLECRNTRRSWKDRKTKTFQFKKHTIWRPWHKLWSITVKEWGLPSALIGLQLSRVFVSQENNNSYKTIFKQWVAFS